MIRDNKLIGSVLILIGTIVGAGMLALPVEAAPAGCILSSSLIILFWFLSTVTGLLIVEINLALPAHTCSFSSMAERTLGLPGKIITWMAYLLLLYAISSAYISGESSIIGNTVKAIFHVDIKNWELSLMFTIGLGVAVFWSTKAVDYLNRGIVSFKGVLLFVTIALLMPHIDVAKLTTSINYNHAKYLFAAVPIFACAFCYQFIIPSLRIYIGDKPKALGWLIVVSTTTALVIYLLWLIANLGIVPLVGNNSFTSLAKMHNSIGAFIQIVSSIVNNKWVTSGMDGFANIAMTTSFLGVMLGLFDFLADGFKRKDSKIGRLQTSLLTFVPPLLFALFYPEGFIIALNYAAVFVSILTFILPALMAYSLRKSATLKSPYRVVGGNSLLVIVVLVGIILVALPIMANLNLLPTLK